VIFYNGGNDVHQPLAYDPRPGRPFGYAVYENALKLSVFRAGFRDLAAGLLMKNPYLKSVLYSVTQEKVLDVADLRREVGYLSDEWKETVADHYARNMEKAFLLGKGAGFRVAVLLHPVLFFKTARAGREREILHDDAFVKHMVDGSDGLARKLAELGGKHAEDGLIVKDLRHVFRDSDQELFRDFIHVNTQGRRIVADAIAEELLAAGVGAASGPGR